MTLADIRDFVASLELTESKNVYMGKLDAKKDQSIGCYHLSRRSSKAHIPIGGLENATYEVKPVSFLVHWNKSLRQTEAAAQKLYDTLVSVKKEEINGCVIQFIRMLVPEPQDVGTDDKGIYEAVIEAEIYAERKGY